MAQLSQRVIDGVYRARERFPHHAALVYLGTSFSYEALVRLIERFAAALHHLGVRKDHKVMLYLPNTPQFVVAYLGAQLVGGVPVTVSPIHTPSELRYMLDDSGAETIVCMDVNYRYVREAFPGSPLRRIVVTTYVDLLPRYKKVLGFLLDKVPRGRFERRDDVHRFATLLGHSPPRPPRVDVDSARQLCGIVYTGGTTGFPKGCAFTHAGMVSFVDEIQQVGEGHIGRGRDTMVLANPLFHQLAQGMLLGMVLNRGNTAVLMPIPETDAILDAVARHRAALLVASPTLYRRILENERLDQYSLDSLRFCWSGGEMLPAEVFNRWKKTVGRPVYQVYGSAEVGFIAMSPLDREPSPTRVGRPLPSRKTRVADPETLRPVPRGEPGELWVTSEFISKEYWNKPDETRKAYVEVDGEIWYRTNDIVFVDENGELGYVDRRADIIQHRGFRVSCSEIEAVLQAHPSVVGSCVVGVPDAKLGERIKAIVVLKEDARGVGGPELIGWCRDRLGPHKVPQYVEFRDMLPRSRVGKLLRREIRDEERRKVVPKKTEPS